MAATTRSRANDRRKEFSATTRKRLLAEATELFTTHGYTGTSLDEVCTAADVTKGALYHHFSGKQALFAAVFDATQAEAVATISEAGAESDDPWDRANARVRTFVQICTEPRFRRIVMQEGPVALGFERFREGEERNTYGLVRDIVAKVLDPYDVSTGIVDTFARVFYGAVTSAGMAVAVSADPEAAAADVETVIGMVLEALRLLVSVGVDFPASEDG